MKDFDQLLQQKPIPTPPPKPTHHQHYTKITQQLQIVQKTKLEVFKDKAIKVAGPLLLTLFTGPLNTASILLQTSVKNTNQSFVRKIQMAGEKSKLVKTGVLGDNKIYKPFEFKGYNDCLAQLGKEGVRGFYKGNLTGIILGLINARLRTQLYDGVNKVANFSDEWKSNILTILTCTIADFVTLPLLFCQTRLVFQNSTSNFRTYSGIIDVYRNTSPSKWFSGATLLLFKNIVFSYSWYSFFKNDPVKSFIFSTFLSHLTTYPFMTIIRQLQTNEIGTAMMNQRKQNVRDCIKRIWTDLGPRGFYRGFLGYAMVHAFLNLIMVDMNVRSGYFAQMAG